MTRRTLAALSLFVLAAGLMAVALHQHRARSASEGTLRGPRPIERSARSMVLITVDTTRPDRLEPYGATNVETPNLAALARRGITFERAYSTAPITLVAHTSILTGLYPPQHGVRNNGTHHVDEPLVTLAEILADEGWRTAAFVSAAVLERRYGLDQGFEVYDDDLSTGRERFPRMVPDRPAEATVAAARQWLDSLEGDEHYFLWVHCYDPHAPYSPPPPYRDDYRDRLYDGEIAYLDSQIGRLLEHPRIDVSDTLITVMGDHGESLGEHGEQTHAMLAYDATLQVPWIMTVPGMEGGRRVAQSVDQVDFLPSVLDVLDIAASRRPAETLGRSLVPLFEGQARVASRDLYGETYLPYFTYGWAKLGVLRRDRWKFINAPGAELFDLERDPRELSNVLDQQPGLSHDLGRDLGELLERLGEGGSLEATLELDREAQEKLRSLGYLAAGNRVTARREDERLDPKDVVDLHVGLERARQLSASHLYPQAERQLRHVLERDPSNLAALVDLASALDAQDRVDDAIAAVERALALDPDYPRLHLMLATLEHRRGNSEQALALLDHALSIDPHFLEAALQRAILTARSAGRDAAQPLFDVLLESHPEQSRVLAHYAHIIDLPAGATDAAYSRLRSAIERDPFLVFAWRVLGDLEEQRGDLAAALDAWRAGLERQPDNLELHARAGLLLARRGDASAEAHLREAVRLGDALRPEIHVALGGVLAEQGRLSEAEALYARVLEEQPGNASALNNRAVAYFRSGRMQEAMADLEKLTRERPGFADAWNNLAGMAVEAGDWTRAEKAARRALELNANLPEAWNNLGVALAKESQEGAEDAYDRALDIEPEYWQARFNRAALYARLGRYDEATAQLDKVIAQVPRFAEAHHDVATLYADHLGRPKLAREHWNAFLRTASPRDPRREQVRQRVAALPVG